MKRPTIVAVWVAVGAAISMHAIVRAQTSIQGVIGQNINIVAGIKDQFVGDMFKQRQNEVVSCPFAVNPDQQIFAYNDYRTVDEPLDGQVGTPTPVQRSVFARLLNPFRRSRPRAVESEEASALAWIGLSFTDNGTDYYTGLHPGSPFSPVVPGDTQLAAYHFQAASDPVFAPTPTHCLLAGIAFTPGGLSAGFVSRFTSTNNQERKSNVQYDFSKVVFTSPARPSNVQASDFFVDKPFIAANATGKVVVAFVVFDESDPAKLSSKVIVFTSNDFGETWPTPGVVVSQPLSRNQSPWILIDPNNANNVYIGWRVFANPKYPTLTNAIVGKRSSNGGVSFDPSIPYPVALLLRAYDAPQTVYPTAPITPRSNAYPTAVIDSHGTISLFIQEYVDGNGYPLSPLAPLSQGKARITQTNSYDRGVTWTLRRAFDYGPSSGPQFMPAAAVTGVPGPVCPGKTGPRSRIAVLYYDARPSYPNGGVFIGGSGARFDVRVAQADPCYTDSGRRPVFSPSQQVSRYTLDGTPAHNIARTAGFGYPSVNAAYRIFNSARSYFTGDYIHITPKISFVQSGTPRTWRPTVASGVSPSDLPSPVWKGSWADARDLILPNSPPPPLAPGAPGFLDTLAWENYRPPHSGLNPDACDNPASRDQNPYVAEISDGLYAAAPVTFRDSLGPRAFPLYVENRTGLKRFFRLTIDPNAGVQASFNLPPATGAFVPKKTSDVAIGTFSSVTGSVIVAANETDPVRITIQEIAALNGAVVPNGLATSLTLNTAGDPNGEGQSESRSSVLDPAPIVTKPFGTVPPSGIVINHNGPNPYVNPFGDNPFGDNPFGDNPFGDNPFGDNPFGDNTTVYDVTDVTFTAASAGTKTSSYSAILNIAGIRNANPGDYKFQAFINRTSPVPGVKGCQTVENQVPVQVSNLKTPFGDNPFGDNPFGDNPFGDNPFGDNAAPGAKDENVSNSTFYLEPPTTEQDTFRGRRAQGFNTYTLRIFKLRPNPAVLITPTAVSLAVESHTPDVVQTPGGGFDFRRDAQGNPVKQVSASGAAVPTTLAFVQQPPATVNVGAAFSVQVAIRDGFNNLVTTSTLPVTLAILSNPGGGTLSGILTRNAVGGIATFPGLSINAGGNGYTLRATAAMVAPATSSPFNVQAFQCYSELPNPSLAFTGTEDYEANGELWTRYNLNVANRASFPDGLFAPAPSLPPCGINANASRTWVNILNPNNEFIYGFCALGSSSELGSLWFAVPRGTPPPSPVHITLNDRACEVTKTSNAVSVIPTYGVLFAGSDTEEFQSLEPNRLAIATVSGAVVNEVNLVDTEVPMNGLAAIGNTLFGSDPESNALVKLTFNGSLLSTGSVTGGTSIECCHEDWAYDGTMLYRANWVSNEAGFIEKINPANGAVVASTPTSFGPVGITFVGAEIWVTNWGTSEVGVWDPATSAFTHKFYVSGLAGGLAYDPGHGVMWVGEGGGCVVPYDLNGNRLNNSDSSCPGFLPFGEIIDTVDGLEFVAPYAAIPIDLNATYLLRDKDPNSRPTQGISLASLGLAPGDLVTLQSRGVFNFCPPPNCQGLNVPNPGLAAAFTAGGAPSSETNISTGLVQFVTQQTLSPPSGPRLDTDLTNDFFVGGFPTTVTIPQGATTLWVTVNDSFFGDNSGSVSLIVTKLPNNF